MRIVDVKWAADGHTCAVTAQMRRGSRWVTVVGVDYLWGGEFMARRKTWSRHGGLAWARRYVKGVTGG